MVTTRADAHRFSLIQGGRSQTRQSTHILTHDDIKEFFTAFAEAIWVDQKRVNKLPRDCFHPYYDKGMWQRNRDDHYSALIKLTMTVDAMPEPLLEEVTKVALDYRPASMTTPLLNFVSDLATQAASPWLYETSSLLFGELIKEARRKPTLLTAHGDPRELLTRWFEYDDPIGIALDPECEYRDALALYIKQEPETKKRTQAKRARSKFAEDLELSIFAARHLDELLSAE